MSEERHSPLAIHPIPDDESAELLRRRDIIRRSKWVAVVALVVLALGAGRTVISRVANGKD